jgi:hypothetical protein
MHVHGTKAFSIRGLSSGCSVGVGTVVFIMQRLATEIVKILRTGDTSVEAMERRLRSPCYCLPSSWWGRLLAP